MFGLASVLCDDQGAGVHLLERRPAACLFYPELQAPGGQPAPTPQEARHPAAAPASLQARDEARPRIPHPEVVERLAEAPVSEERARRREPSGGVVVLLGM